VQKQAMSNTEAKVRDAAADAQVLREINAAVAEPDVPRAVALAKHALGDGLKDPLLYNLLSHDLQQQGRYAEALAQLERAYDMTPGDVIIINAIGRCLVLQNRTAEAIKVYDAALAIEPNLPQSHLNKGDALAMLADFDQARFHFERAADIHPGYAEAFSGLASLALRRGDIEDAQALAERALALSPTHDIAALTLAEIETGRGDAISAASRLRRVLAQTELNGEVRARSASLLGDALDAQGRAGEAFAEYSAAGDETQRAYASQYAQPGAPTILEMTRWLTTRFEAASVADWAAAPAPPPPSPEDPAAHIFFVGFPRSGTTLLEQILASNPDVVVLDERDTLTEATRDLFTSDAKLDRLMRLDADHATTYRDHYWRRVRTYCPNVAGKVFIDKHPLNSDRLPLIDKLFPNAKVLFALRDPRDVVLSCFRRRFRMNPAMYQLCTLEGAAIYYDAVMRLAQLYKLKLRLPTKYVRYEALVEDLQREVRDVCEFIGVGWNDAMLDFVETARRRGIRTPSARQVERGLYSEGVGQWRAYAQQMAPVMPLLAPWVETFGYPAT
jgi:tetratricopeptide (TPR) repeat protein